MQDTDFKFGHNVHDNANPWGRNTEPELELPEKQKDVYPRGRQRKSSESSSAEIPLDSGPVSGLVAGGYFGYLETAFETDAFLKMVWLRLNSLKEDIRDMLPAAGTTEKQTPRKNTGGPARIPFLTIEHLTKQPKEAKILSVRAMTREWNGKASQVVSYKLAMDGHTFMWDLKLTNPNLKTLQNKFGLDENDHVGQKILIFLEQDEHTEQYWPRVDFPKGNNKKQ